MKELAINAANDHNTDRDRATLQKEFAERQANIDAIAAETDYNGKKLLDGRWHESYDVTETTAETTAETVTTTTSTTVADGWFIPYTTKLYGWPHPYQLVSSGVTEPTEIATYTKTGNDVTITSNGVYTMSDNENITLADGVTDVKFTQSADTVNEVYITAPATGNANFWLEDTNVANSNDENFIKFQGENNVLNFKGTNIFNKTVAGGAYPKAIINMGDGLTVEGGCDGTGSFKVNWSNHPSATLNGSTFGTDENQNTEGTLQINSGEYRCNIQHYNAPFFGAAPNSSIGNIVVNGGIFIELDDIFIYDSSDCLIGTGSLYSTIGNITVRNAVVVADKPKKNSPIIGLSGGFSNLKSIDNIYVENSYLYCIGDGAGLGTGGTRGGIGNITVTDSYLYLQSQNGAGIGSGRYATVGDITIINSNIDNVSSTNADAVGKGVDGYCGTVTISGTATPTTDISSYTTTTTTTTTTTDTASNTTYQASTASVPGTPLHIHHGTRANQSMAVHIRDMHANSLKTDTLSADDEKELLRLTGSDTEKLQAILDAAHGKAIDEADITTRDNALVAIRLADGALEYALDEATTIGSYISRLEYTAANLTTANENTQAGESTIRDADMAKSMTDYTKSNVLTQAAQTMLAQANQSFGNVLSLLQ